MTNSAVATCRINVPENSFARDCALVAVMRGHWVGSVHRGSAALADVDGSLLFALGDAEQPVFLRSAAKPFQVLPAVIHGAVQRFDISERELAVLCASHSGEPRHLETVLSVLTKIGLDESALRCGTHPPNDQVAAIARWRAGIEPSPVCNNCSGAHTGMLLACVHLGLPIDSYGDPQHPLQIEIQRVLGAFAGVRPESIEQAIDNCAVPTFRLALGQAAQAFARLGAATGVADEYAAAARSVVAAMTSHPEMIGGEHRFDSDLMRTAHGAIVAKGGAEGFQGLGLLKNGTGLALKISDGNDRAVPPAVMRLLTNLDLLDDEAAVELAPYSEPEQRDLLGQLVGRLTAVFAVSSGA